MIWMSWRQFRTQALAGIALAVVLAVYLVILGTQVRHTYNTDYSICRANGGCSDLMHAFTGQYSLRFNLIGYVLIVVPGLLGVFWGAPLITRELETGTHQLVWNQSVTRARWLSAKLLVVGAITVALVAAYSVLLTWAASPYDQVAGNRFSQMAFDERNIAPIGYAAFAFALGAALGLLIRKTLPAMALTLVIFAIVQVFVPLGVRPHYATPVTVSVPMTAATVSSLNFFGEYGTIGGLTIPGAWVVSTSPMLNAQGQDIGHSSEYAACIGQSDIGECFGKLDLHVQASTQPAGRYWDFQWYELAVFLVLSALLAGLSFVRIRGRLS
jgi:ABC-type transport system involved in multi-copper enzyme maturation permease subunit